MRTQTGSSLIELMVGCVIALFMLAGLTYISSNTTNASSDALQRDRLNYHMQRALYMMSYDLRRAGYWGNASSSLGSGANSNPSMASGTDVSISGSCLLFTYDKNEDGSLSTSNGASSHEHFGYRLQSGAIQGLTTDSNYSCASTNSAWENITDTNAITVTALSYTPTNVTRTLPGMTHTVVIRYITISMTASLANDTTVTQTLSENIRVRADKFVP